MGTPFGPNHLPLLLLPLALMGQAGCPTEGTDADGDGYTLEGGDCDDDDASVNPGAVEACGDGIDNNCDGVVDEGCPEPGFRIRERVSELAVQGQDNGRAEPPVFEAFIYHTDMLPFDEAIGGQLEYVEAESEQRSIVEPHLVAAQGRALAVGQDDYGYGQGEASSSSYFYTYFEVLAPTQIDLVGELTLSQGSDGGGLLGAVSLAQEGGGTLYSITSTRREALSLDFSDVLEPGGYFLLIETSGDVGLSGGGDAYPEARVSYVVELIAN